jgi:DNA-binding NtrC family response regulator
MTGGAGTRTQMVGLHGRPDAGMRHTIAAIAAAARRQGYVPLASTLVTSSRLDALRDRSVLLIHRGDADAGRNRWAATLDLLGRSPRPHVCLFTGVHDVPHVPSIHIGRINEPLLLAAVTPEPIAARDQRRLRHLASRADGLPGRFARYLGIGATLGRERRPAPLPPLAKVSEQPATYLSPSRSFHIVGSWADARGLTHLKTQADNGVKHLRSARAAEAERMVRAAAAGLARRQAWADAGGVALQLGQHLAARGRPRSAREIMEQAREWIAAANDAALSIRAATLTASVWIDLAHLDAAENLLRGAVAGSRSVRDPGLRVEADLGLARCLFWRGRYGEAETTAGRAEAPPGSAAEVRVLIARSRIAVGRREIGAAISLATAATEKAATFGDDGLTARAACAAAFAHLATGDREAVARDVGRCVAAARLARSPLLALDGRLLGAENDRRANSGAASPAVAERLLAPAVREVPAPLRARASLLRDLHRQARAADAVRRQVAATGFEALALFIPVTNDSATFRAASSTALEILSWCQEPHDQSSMLSDACIWLRHRLGAAAVACFGREGGALRLLASQGPVITPAIAERVATLGRPIGPHRSEERLEGGAPVTFAGDVLGAMVARWPLGGAPDPTEASFVLGLAAAALAPAVAAAAVRAPPGEDGGPGSLIGVSRAMTDLRAAIERAASTPYPVLVHGETGSGKELVAKALHHRGRRRDRPFCSVNCAALPEDLIEAELFGHTRGAFTGAMTERPGVFEEAHTGTLFLDEIGELSARGQAKVLRTVQEGEVRRVGENISRRVEVRLVAATNRDLRTEAAEGRFRLDLLYRLDVIHIEVPPLRERPEDIPLLAACYWRLAMERVGSSAVLSPAALAALAGYAWPGNVRELQNVLAALAVRSPRRGLIPASALPASISARPVSQSWRLDEARRAFDERFVRAALVRTAGHRGRAAHEMGMTRQGLSKLIARLGVDRPVP